MFTVYRTGPQSHHTPNRMWKHSGHWHEQGLLRLGPSSTVKVCLLTSNKWQLVMLKKRSKGNTHPSLVEWKTVQSLWKSVWWFKKLGINIHQDPVIPLLDTDPKNALSSPRDTCSPVIAAVFTIARNWKPPRCPSTEDHIMKTWDIYTVNNTQLIKRESEFHRWMDGDRKTTILSEITQIPKSKFWMESPNGRGDKGPTR